MAVAAVTLGRRHHRPEERTEKEEKGEDDDLINEGEGVARPNIKRKGKGAFGLVICFNVCVTYKGNYHNVLFQFKYTKTSLHSPSPSNYFGFHHTLIFLILQLLN